MESIRAEQIIQQKDDVTVHYHEVPVWIQSVNSAGHTARVYTSSHPDEEMIVLLSDLTEK